MRLQIAGPIRAKCHCTLNTTMTYNVHRRSTRSAHPSAAILMDATPRTLHAQTRFDRAPGDARKQEKCTNADEPRQGHGDMSGSSPLSKQMRQSPSAAIGYFAVRSLSLGEARSCNSHISEALRANKLEISNFLRPANSDVPDISGQTILRFGFAWYHNASRHEVHGRWCLL